jgi:hypothetical protein
MVGVIEWSAEFNRQHPNPSEAGVRDLAWQLDFTKDDIDGNRWLDALPPTLVVRVNGKMIYGISGICADIICGVRGEMRNNKAQ